jgi:uncharacterized protein YabN with tetrapyrrole methylase and pyrophosphatase domain
MDGSAEPFVRLIRQVGLQQQEEERRAILVRKPVRVEEEFGDVLFSLMQWARKKGVDPDAALRRQMIRFKGRFAAVEDEARAAGGWENRDLDQMEAAWQAAKRRSLG